MKIVSMTAPSSALLRSLRVTGSGQLMEISTRWRVLIDTFPVYRSACWSRPWRVFRGRSSFACHLRASYVNDRSGWSSAVYGTLSRNGRWDAVQSGIDRLGRQANRWHWLMHPGAKTVDSWRLVDNRAAIEVHGMHKSVSNIPRYCKSDPYHPQNLINNVPFLQKIIQKIIYNFLSNLTWQRQKNSSENIKHNCLRECNNYK